MITAMEVQVEFGDDYLPTEVADVRVAPNRNRPHPGNRIKRVRECRHCARRLITYESAPPPCRARPKRALQVCSSVSLCGLSRPAAPGPGEPADAQTQ